MTLSIRPLVLFTLFAVGSGSGCICVSNGPDEAPDARFVFSFAGTQDCVTARVGSVRITFENANGILPIDVACPHNGGGLEVVADDLLAGTYTVLFQAFDVTDTSFVAYSTRLSIDHNEGPTRRYDVTLTRTTIVTTYFTFAANSTSQNGMTCAQAAVTDMQLVFTRTGAAAQTFDVPCHDVPTVTDAATLLDLAPGNYTVDARAFDSGGTRRYTSIFQGVQVMGAAANDIVLNVLPEGPATLVEFEFKLPNNQTCAQLAVSYVNYTLEDPSGQNTSTQPYTVNCDVVTGRPQKSRFEAPSGLPAGKYLVGAAAYSSSNVLRAAVVDVEVWAPSGGEIGWPIQLGVP